MAASMLACIGGIGIGIALGLVLCSCLAMSHHQDKEMEKWADDVEITTAEGR